MEKTYKVKGLRKLRTFWGECLVCSIYLDNRQIATMKDCPDSGKAIFEFPLNTDKLVFEAFVNKWWASIKPFQLYDGSARDLAAESVSQLTTPAEKMRYWVKAMTVEAEKERMKMAA